jgi:hypothetical protein
MDEDEVKVPYKEKIGAVINLKTRKIYIEKDLSSREKREVTAIANAYIEFYVDEGSVPEHKEALIFAAYSLIPNGTKNYFGSPISSFSAKELSELANVTEDFAKFRLNLEKIAFNPADN